MNKVIYFNNDDQKNDYCAGRIYFDFLDYAFAEADYFMLVYVNYYSKGYTKMMKYFKKALIPYQVKTRSNPCWPGTLCTNTPQTTYKIVFYKTADAAKEILKKVNKLSDWAAPSLPQDLALFKGNTCWFYSVGHEKMGAFINATEKDLDFLEIKKLASREDVFESQSNYYCAFDEELE